MVIYVIYKDDMIDKIKDVLNVEVNNTRLVLCLKDTEKQIDMALIRKILII